MSSWHVSNRGLECAMKFLVVSNTVVILQIRRQKLGEVGVAFLSVPIATCACPQYLSFCTVIGHFPRQM